MGAVRKYRDFHAEESRSRANKELGYISRIFSWAYAYQKVKFNPAKSIPKLSIKPRQHYAEDKDYELLLQVAKESGYWYMPIAMEIAYLCRMRLSEVLDLTETNALPDGLLINRREGSQSNIVAWTENLSALWQSAISKRNEILMDRHQPLADNRPIFISEQTGDILQRGALKTAKKRIDAQKLKQTNFKSCTRTSRFMI